MMPDKKTKQTKKKSPNAPQGAASQSLECGSEGQCQAKITTMLRLGSVSSDHDPLSSKAKVQSELSDPASPVLTGALGIQVSLWSHSPNLQTCWGCGSSADSLRTAQRPGVQEHEQNLL